MRSSCSLVLVALLVASAAALAEPSERYPVTIQEGLTPRMSPSAVAVLVRSAASRRRPSGAPEPSVLGVECVDGAEFRAAFSHPSMHNDSPIWKVRVSSPALYVVDDANGEIVAYGVPGGGSQAAPDLERLQRGR